MIRSLLVGALLAYLLSYVLAITVGIFAPATMILFGLALVLMIVGAMLPTDRPLKPLPPPTSADAPTVCPVCGGPLRWVPEFDRWWCASERKYR